ncbi:MAG: AsnC family transcriptional regulator [Gammaproteobacteria bacterium]|nr:AsnC family transcriptional regulator [Gammaproteobacteria bacterium]MDH3857357.1 AsnC family transcriptional regulator [Gammaproteobacteria bacterium]
MASEAAVSAEPRVRGIASTEDDLNRAIIKMLQQDGRLPYKDIAKALKVSEGTIRNRVQSMKRGGALKIVALADPMAIRYQADAMIGIKVASPATPRSVAHRLSEHGEVVYVLWVSGRYDLLIEVVCETSGAFQSFLEQHCFGHEDIDQIEVMSGIEMFKNQFLLKRQAQ